jgi:hypothetical protein
MIDEKRLIERLWEQHKGIKANAECYTDAEEVADEICNVVSIIDEQPKVGEWIPIGQYPTEPSLLCFEDGSMAVGYYDEPDCVCVNIGGGYVDYSLEEPIAYMTLPPAYKGE